MNADDINACDIRQVADYYVSTGKMSKANNDTYVCPICGSGSNGNHNTGLSYWQEGNKLRCFPEHKNFSVTDLVCAVEGLEPQGESFKQALKIACEITGLTYEESSSYTHHTPNRKAKKRKTYKPMQEDEKSHYSRLQEAQDGLEKWYNEEVIKWKIPNYRGLTLETLKRANAGYLSDYGSDPAVYGYYGYRAVLLPNDNGGVLVRSIADNYKKMKNFSPKRMEGKTAPTSLNLPPADADIKNCVIVLTEGVINALSILQSTDWQAYVVAVGGAGDYRKTVDALYRRYPNDKPQIIVMFDNDSKDGKNAGQKAALDALELLRLAGFVSVNRVLVERPNYDANDILNEEGGEKLAEYFNQAVESARDELIKETERMAELKQETIDVSECETLEDIEDLIQSFEEKKNQAIESLRGIETFNSSTLFSNEVIDAAAYARLYDVKAYQELKTEIKLYGRKNADEKINLNDWQSIVKSRATVIESEYKALLVQKTKLKAESNNEKFLSHNQDLNFNIPNGFSVSMGGVYKIFEDNEVLVCRRPVIISGKTKSVEEKNFKLILQYWTSNGIRQTLPAMPASTVFNRATVVTLTDYGLPTSSHTSSLLVDYLDAFNAANDADIPITCTVPRCGWYNFNNKDIFVDPRRSCTIDEGDKTYPLTVDNSSTFASTLTSKGSLTEWIKAYDLAKKSPVARFIVAAGVASPLLKALGERNFLIFIKAHTRAGKTTALYLAASAIGSEKMIRSFDATKNGLLGAAADVNDYAFLVDEKQVADNRLAEQLSLIVYALSNGIGRTKLNKDSTLKKTADWRTIAIMTGETNLLDDSATGGSFTRSLLINASKTILPSDDCKKIRDIIKENYGLVMPLILEKILSIGFKELNEYFAAMDRSLSKIITDILPEHRRYINVVALADFLLNFCLGMEEKAAYDKAVRSTMQIFEYIPTKDEIDDTQREIDFVQGFIAQNQSSFIGGNLDITKMHAPFYGKIGLDGYTYITVAALKKACKDNGFTYDKVVDDLIAAGAFIPSDKIPKEKKAQMNTHVIKMHSKATRCYKFRYSDYAPELD